jgi:hypothetical protein
MSDERVRMNKLEAFQQYNDEDARITEASRRIREAGGKRIDAASVPPDHIITSYDQIDTLEGNLYLNPGHAYSVAGLEELYPVPAGQIPEGQRSHIIENTDVYENSSMHMADKRFALIPVEDLVRLLKQRGNKNYTADLLYYVQQELAQNPVTAALRDLENNRGLLTYYRNEEPDNTEDIRRVVETIKIRADQLKQARMVARNAKAFFDEAHRQGLDLTGLKSTMTMDVSILEDAGFGSMMTAEDQLPLMEKINRVLTANTDPTLDTRIDAASDFVKTL